MVIVLRLCQPCNSYCIGGIALHSINGGSISLRALQENQRILVIARMAMAVQNRLSAIDAEMGQLKNEIQERRRALNLFLRNVRARDPAEAERRIGAARENIRDLERRLQVLREEQQELIVRAAHLGDRGD